MNFSEPVEAEEIRPIDLDYAKRYNGNNALVIYEQKIALKQLLNNAQINLRDLERMIPKDCVNTFKSSLTIKQGFKYNYIINDAKVEIKWHSADLNALSKFPNSNSGNGWTAQIKLKNKFLGQDGNFYRKVDNITHIPVGGIE